MQVFPIINKDRIMINVDVNAKNWLTKEYVIKDLFGIQVIMNVNAINHVMLENIYIRKIVSVRKRLIDKLVEECSENIDEIEMVYNYTLNDNKNLNESCEYSFCTVYIILFIIAFLIIIGISSAFVHFHW